jgi:hypothetical protein
MRRESGPLDSVMCRKGGGCGGEFVLVALERLGYEGRTVYAFALRFGLGLGTVWGGGGVATGSCHRYSTMPSLVRLVRW